MRRKRTLRWLAFIVLASLAPLALLFVTSPVVAERYLSLFVPEDGSFESLEPRTPLVGSGSFELPIADAVSTAISQSALDEMQTYAAEQDSWALIIIQNGVIQREWYADGWGRQRLSQSQSMHKSVLPILVQAAIEDGYIASLEDPVGMYLDEWRDDPRGAITLQQLLWMSSGLREYPFSLNPWSDAFLWLFDTNITPILLRTPLDWEPGSKFQYNNINSELLGLIIERATGQRYADYLSLRLWQPMGGVGGDLWLDSEGGKAHSSCCLLVPAMDWAKFGMLLLGRGEVNGERIVSAEFVDKMVTASPDFAWYGYQIWLGYSRELNPRAKLLAGGYQRSEPFIAADTYYASGFGAQRVYVVPSAELIIVRMGPASGPDPVRESWDNTYLVNTALRNQVPRQRSDSIN